MARELDARLHRVIEPGWEPGRLRRDEPLAPLTTLRVGGPADWFLDARSPEEVAAAVVAARELGLPLTLLGGGSNALVSDAGIRGLVVRWRHGGIEQTEHGLVRASAGATVNGLVRWTIHRGLAGLESWAGTPGTIGGAVAGNAHFGGRGVGEHIAGVTLLGPDGQAPRVAADEMEFAYGRSRIQSTGELVLAADFRVTDGAASDLRDTARASVRFRKRTQPLRKPSAGCVFRNPDPAEVSLPEGTPCSAGALIDRAGLKGSAVGGAEVSRRHANFIVTAPGATASDVRALIERCQDAVAAKYGVALAPEIVFLGESGAPS